MMILQNTQMTASKLPFSPSNRGTPHSEKEKATEGIVGDKVHG